MGRAATTEEKFELAHALSNQLLEQFKERGLDQPTDLRQVLKMALEANSPTTSEVKANNPFVRG